jgi:hypothetical protein
MSRAYLFVISALLITRDYEGPGLRLEGWLSADHHSEFDRRGLGRGRFMDFSLRPSVVARSINRHGLGKATTSLA